MLLGGLGGSGLLTWFAWGAATNRTGPCLGTFQEPLGWTSRKKRSTKMDMNHRNVSYFLLLMGYSSVAGFGEAALWGGTGRLEPLAGAEAEAEPLSEGMSGNALYQAQGIVMLACVLLKRTRENRGGPSGARLLFLWRGGSPIQPGSGLMGSLNRGRRWGRRGHPAGNGTIRARRFGILIQT
jgi:hypothetical protein